MSYPFEPIGILHSGFREKFGIPRQPGLVPAAPATLELLPPYARDESVLGLQEFSHVWLLFVFHHHLDAGWRPTVRPPRLGGNRRVGVFASRSPFRPNPIGLSVVELASVRREGKGLMLELYGADLADGTPVLDIKPYLPYADAPSDPRSGFAPTPPEPVAEVGFLPEARRSMARFSREQGFDLEPMIVQLLQTDPRPAYLGDGGERIFGMRLFDFDLRWRVEADRVVVIDLATLVN